MSEGASTDVFINCPFDPRYKPIFEALVFAIFACQFRARSALEIEDSSELRLHKLYGIIEASRYGVHDLSRTELDADSGLPRFNMPLELGIFLGAKRYGDDTQKAKRCLILDVERYRYHKFISDIAALDIRAHNSDPLLAIERMRDWLANVSRRRLPSAKELKGWYADFLDYKRRLARRSRFDAKAIPYVDYEGMVASWLLEAEERKSKPRKKPKKARRGKK